MWSYYSSRVVGTVASETSSSLQTLESQSSRLNGSGTATATISSLAKTVDRLTQTYSTRRYGGLFSQAGIFGSHQSQVISRSTTESYTNTSTSSTAQTVQKTDSGVTYTGDFGFSREVMSATGSTVQSGQVTTASTQISSFSDSYSQSSSSWSLTIMTSQRATSSDGGTSQTTVSLTFSGTDLDSRATYRNTTVTSSTSSTLWQTTTSTRGSTYPTSTAGDTTTTTSSTESYTTQRTTTTVSSSFVTYATTWAVPPFYLDTIIIVPTSEWAWKVTTTGTGQVTALGASFTSTILTEQGQSRSLRHDTYALSASVFATSAITVLSSAQTTTTLTALRTSTLSTYSVAVGSFASAPFTDTTGATINYTTTRTSSFTYRSTFTTTSNYIALSDAFTRGTSTFTGSIATTTSTGSSTSAVTFSFPYEDLMFYVGSTSSSESGLTLVDVSTTSLQSKSAELTFSRQSFAFSFTNAAVKTPDTISYTAASIGRGFQASALGRSVAIGTNLSLSASSSTDTTTLTFSTTSSVSLALGWPRTVQTPIMRAGDTATHVGSVPQTLTNTRQTSRFGGVGWETVSTIGTDTIGIHRMTTQDATGGTATTMKTWNITASTFSLAGGQALAAESVPLLSVSSNATYSQVVSFSAHTSA